MSVTLHYVQTASKPEAFLRGSGSVKQLTVHDAMDFYLSARKKTQLYRGTARLSDTAIK